MVASAGTLIKHARAAGYWRIEEVRDLGRNSALGFQLAGALKNRREGVRMNGFLRNEIPGLAGQLTRHCHQRVIRQIVEQRLPPRLGESGGQRTRAKAGILVRDLNQQLFANIQATIADVICLTSEQRRW
jgi:hypothetical protein